MITKQEYQRSKYTGRENFALTLDEQAALEKMARELGIPKSAIIRDGLQKVYSEFQAFQQAADHDSTYPAN